MPKFLTCFAPNQSIPPLYCNFCELIYGLSRWSRSVQCCAPCHSCSTLLLLQLLPHAPHATSCQATPGKQLCRYVSKWLSFKKFKVLKSPYYTLIFSMSSKGGCKVRTQAAQQKSISKHCKTFRLHHFINRFCKKTSVIQKVIIFPYFCFAFIDDGTM